MKAAFDDSADRYDEQFTNSTIGRLQRNKVWTYLEQTFRTGFPAHVLELNCGTGEDAVFFAKHGSQVLATDVSEKMLRVAEHKIHKEGLETKVETMRLDISNLPTHALPQQYDLVFSDFGGLNCVSGETLQVLLERLKQLLQPRGRIILVLMPRFCAWETLYFLKSFNFKKAFRRRRRRPQTARLAEGEVTTWYHSPADLKRMAGSNYDIVHLRPVGISLPPSYLQETFAGRDHILDKLDAIENRLATYGSLSRFADHFLIDLKLK